MYLELIYSLNTKSWFFASCRQDVDYGRTREIDRERERQKELIFGKAQESSSESEGGDIDFDEDEEEEEQKIERMRKQREELYKVRIMYSANCNLRSAVYV